MECNLVVLIHMIVNLINNVDRKPRPVSIGNVFLSILIPLTKTSKGSPALMTVTCKDI